MSLSHLHEFHCVLDRGLKNDLLNLEVFRETGSLSGVIMGIISLIMPVIKREHRWGDQREGRYLPVCDDPEEMRVHVHVYFPEDVYREFKLLHADLNFFSLAQLVRWLLRFFLVLVKEYGDNVIDELHRIFRQWEKENGENSLTMRKIIRQLWRIIRHLPGQTGFINIYCKNFSPFWILRL